MKIPVFHDDQHGTAIIVGAALLNGLKVVGKDIGQIKLVVSGAGAAALACLDMLVSLGVRMENIVVTDIKGVVYKGRTEEMDDNKARYAVTTAARTLGEVVAGADVFLGLSAGGVLKPEMVKKMADRPLIFALANPHPEILPEAAHAARPDVIIATGRSDYPNQVNNALCFPYIFRGALDVGASTINEAMKQAAVKAIAQLAQAEQSDTVATAYGDQNLRFGPDYLIPRPFDPRLITEIAPAVAQAAMDSGIAARPLADMRAYCERLSHFIHESGWLMKPVLDYAKAHPKRLVYAEGEDERVLHAVQAVVDEGMAHPILIGRPAIVAQNIARLGLRLRPGENFVLINPPAPDVHNTQIAAAMVSAGEADAMLCGMVSRPQEHLRFISDKIGLHAEASVFATMNILLLPGHTLFVCDTHINVEPTAEQLADITLLAVVEMRRFGIEPRVALLSHSNFGGFDDPSARKMRRANELLRERAPGLEVDGEMHADTAVSDALRRQLAPDARLHGPANLLVMPSLDAANISFNLLKVLAGDGITIGPVLLGAAKSVHIMTPSATVRRIVEMSALAVAGVQAH